MKEKSEIIIIPLAYILKATKNLQKFYEYRNKNVIWQNPQNYIPNYLSKIWN